MTTFVFNSYLGQSVAFDPDADVLALDDAASGFTITTSGSDLVVSKSGVGSVTLTGVTLGQLTSTNVTATSSSVYVGDETTNDVLDDVGQTVINAAGNDDDNLVFGLGGGDTISLGDGANVIFGGTGVTDSTDGADDITVGTGGSTIYGNAGNDSITAGATGSGSTLSVFGGLGNDSVDTAAFIGDVYVNLADGTDIFNDNNAAGAGSVTLLGGGGADTLDLSTATGSTTIYGGTGGTDSTDGADTITNGTGNTTIYANAGNDTVTITAAASAAIQTFINGGLGNDNIGGAENGLLTVAGGLGADTIDLDSGNSDGLIIYGGNGLADTVDGADTINFDSAGEVSAYGNAGNDTITAEDVNDDSLINGGLGDDSLIISGLTTGNITLTGAAGDDNFDVTTSGNTNTVVITDFAVSELLTLDINGAAATSLTVATSNGRITLTDGTDVVLLSAYAGVLNSSNLDYASGEVVANFGGAADTLDGSAGGDYILAGANGDTFDSLAGNDKLTGGAGNDTFGFDGDDLTTNDTIDGAAGTNVLNFTADNNGAAVVDADFTSISNVQTVLFDDINWTNTFTFGNEAELAGFVTFTSEGTGANDVTIVLDANYDLDATVTGGAAGDTLNASGMDGTQTVSISGAGGDDTINGGAGADTLVGGTGADDLLGNDGNDSITGDAGADDITGGAGADTLTGGADADNFTYTAATQTGITAATVDVVTDFNANADTFTFNTNAGGGNASAFVDGSSDDYDTGNATLAAAATAFIVAEAGLQAAEAAGAFEYAGRTYLLINDDADSDFDQADGDYLVDITGFTGTLGAADIITT